GQPVLEGRDGMAEFRQVRDPVKMINVYGYGYDGILGPAVAGVCQDMGLGPARTLALPGWHHVASEVYYDGEDLFAIRFQTGPGDPPRGGQRPLRPHGRFGWSRSLLGQFAKQAHGLLDDRLPG